MAVAALMVVAALMAMAQPACREPTTGATIVLAVWAAARPTTAPGPAHCRSCSPSVQGAVAVLVLLLVAMKPARRSRRMEAPAKAVPLAPPRQVASSSPRSRRRWASCVCRAASPPSRDQSGRSARHCQPPQRWADRSTFRRSTCCARSSCRRKFAQGEADVARAVNTSTLNSLEPRPPSSAPPRRLESARSWPRGQASLPARDALPSSSKTQ